MKSINLQKTDLMMLQKFKIIVQIPLLALPLYVIHLILFSETTLSTQTNEFHYSLEALYGIFAIATLLILLALIKMKEKNPESVGNTFMLLTCLKMGAAYFVLRPVLVLKHTNQHFEKINFLIIFLLFLAIETIITVKLINKKD
jgi:hypothetical protein